MRVIDQRPSYLPVVISWDQGQNSMSTRCGSSGTTRAKIKQYSYTYVFLHEISSKSTWSFELWILLFFSNVFLFLLSLIFSYFIFQLSFNFLKVSSLLIKYTRNGFCLFKLTSASVGVKRLLNSEMRRYAKREEKTKDFPDRSSDKCRKWYVWHWFSDES